MSKMDHLEGILQRTNNVVIDETFQQVLLKRLHKMRVLRICQKNIGIFNDATLIKIVLQVHYIFRETKLSAKFEVGQTIMSTG